MPTDMNSTAPTSDTGRGAVPPVSQLMRLAFREQLAAAERVNKHHQRRTSGRQPS